MKQFLETTVVGECYRSDVHYYMQRENDVLHLNSKNPLINDLDVNFLKNYKMALIYPISNDEFNETLSNILKRLDILKIL